MTVNLHSAHQLRKGRTQLAVERVRTAKEKLAAHARELALCEQDRRTLEEKIQSCHKNGSDQAELDGHREALAKVALREQALQPEQSYLERLVREAEEALTAAIAEEHTAERRLHQQDGQQVANNLRRLARDMGATLDALEDLREKERIAKDSARGHPESETMPTFEWVTCVDGWDRDLIRQLVDRMEKAEVELERRQQRR